ncbi:UDP-N-acetylenolpyruvoylglucosamine reductase [Candidatus Peribacteria bacterium RIFCSPLOWO2_12_FULL_53_10]|nr:MAG: UDP-N-acetylenolpyruvoylglucosamine reductase [Candidatus Peribacteria bacterium RIFCSPLOWO2_12_FULL_53_10]
MQSDSAPNIDIRKSVPLCEYTTFHIGGLAEYFVSVKSVPELRCAVAWAHAKKVPVTVLGGGSNVFASDEGVHGLIVHNKLMGMEITEDGDEVLLTVGAGEAFDDIVAFCVGNGWWGLENLSCIPGSVGATPIQNIGAYGVEIQEHIAFVEAYDMKTDALVRLEKDMCAFGYRDSLFKHEEGKRYMVTAVAYRLSKTPHPVLHYRDLALWNEGRSEKYAPTLGEIRTAVCDIRSRKFPDWNVLGTAGSFFKNPTISGEHFAELRRMYPELPGYRGEDGTVKVALGWILDHVLDLRGHREGNVGTYEGQALVIVNHGGAGSAELETFVRGIAEKIFDATKLVVEWEVTKLA